MSAAPDVIPERFLRGDRCSCRACGEYFNSAAAFDRHRIGDYTHEPPTYGRRCRTLNEMRAAGMGQTGDGWWTTDSRKRAPWTLAARVGDEIGTGMSYRPQEGK